MTFCFRLELLGRSGGLACLRSGPRRKERLDPSLLPATARNQGNAWAVTAGYGKHLLEAGKCVAGAGAGSDRLQTSCAAVTSVRNLVDKPLFPASHDLWSA